MLSVNSFLNRFKTKPHGLAFIKNEESDVTFLLKITFLAVRHLQSRILTENFSDLKSTQKGGAAGLIHLFLAFARRNQNFDHSSLIINNEYE